VTATADVTGTSAPSVSAAGKGRIYFNSTSNKFLHSDNAGAFSQFGQWDLLKANSGTDTNAGATNVDTYAMASQLTALDELVVMVALEAVTQAVATPSLYNSTDSVTLGSFITMAAADNQIGQTYSRQAQSAATKVLTNMGVAAGVTNTQSATFTTNWTGAWTLALRHGGVTAGGTLKWSWSVYRVRGQ
jgi:hypothetical protein